MDQLIDLWRWERVTTWTHAAREGPSITAHKRWRRRSPWRWWYVSICVSPCVSAEGLFNSSPKEPTFSNCGPIRSSFFAFHKRVFCNRWLQKQYKYKNIDITNITFRPWLKWMENMPILLCYWITLHSQLTYVHWDRRVWTHLPHKD